MIFSDGLQSHNKLNEIADSFLNNIENSKIDISKDNSSDFNNIAKRIIEKNISKPYPDINFIQD